MRMPKRSRELERNQQIIFRYSTAQGEMTDGANPNGSLCQHCWDLQ